MSAIETLKIRFADINALEKASSLMAWDQQVLMPPGGTPARSAHLAILARMAHELLTSDQTRRAVADSLAESEPGSVDAAMARAAQRRLDTQAKLPVEQVERKSRVSSDAYEAWKQAKRDSDFATLRPYLEELFDIAGETASALGYENHIYDPLIDLYEEGATFQDAHSMFETIKAPIVALVAEIAERGTPVADDFMYLECDQEALRAFAQETAAGIGFDFNRGRLNLAPNAFCTNFSMADVRMTARPSEHLKGVVSSSLHEMGHGLYEQGSPPEWDRTPLAGGASLAVHESQSRLWENIVGRSRPFWSFFLPKLQTSVPSLGSVSLAAFHRAINKVEPSFIRVGADELTYNLHILVRFELEVEILTGSLAVRDLPDAWNSKYRDYLGIDPPKDALGVLQDVHWSRGSVGYFPTYAMGNLIGGQLWSCLQRDLPDSDDLMAGGRFAPILGWLQERIYSQAKLYQPRTLVERVTGTPMKADEWLAYAAAKYLRIYDL